MENKTIGELSSEELGLSKDNLFAQMDQIRQTIIAINKELTKRIDSAISPDNSDPE